jgi:branched-subunit amino acid transport protein
VNFWVLIVACAVVTFVIKALGPVALGGRQLPRWFTLIVTSMAPALLVALVFTETFSESGELAVGADAVGVGAAGVVLLRGGSIILGVFVAALVTACLRAF